MVTDDTNPAIAPISTGVAGLDEVLQGGLTPNRVYLVEGRPGTGKTTLGLHFLLDGLHRGEKGLYVSLSETAGELRTSAATHDWSLDQLSILELVAEAELSPEHHQSLLHPSELDFSEITDRILDSIRKDHPTRVVFDSLSEMRVLAESPSRYRRQILAVKHFLLENNCSALFLDNHAIEPGDLRLRS